MQMEEQILAEGCRKGDDMARKELYDRYAGRLLSICMRYAETARRPKTCSTTLS